MVDQIDNVVVNDDTTGLNRAINVASDDLFLSVDLTLQSGAVLTADNIKRGTTDPNVALLAGNEGDVYQRTLAATGQLWVNTDGTTTGWSQVLISGVTGPGSSTDNAIARWDGTGGDTLQDSSVLIDDSDNITGVVDLTMSGALVGRDFTELTPSAISSDQDDYDPTDFGTADLVRQDLTGDQDITGFAAPGAGDNHFFWIVNIDGGSDELTLTDEDTSSSAANRIICPDAEDLLLKPGEGASLMYDETSSRWRVVGLNHVHDYDDFVSATSTNTLSNSSSFSQISSMTITPPAGTYFVVFSADIAPPSSAGRIAIFVGGVGGTKDADSERDVADFFSNRYPGGTQGRVSVNGSQAIVVGYNGASSCTFRERSLAIRRVRS